MHFVAVHLVARRAEAGVASAIPAGVDVAGRLDDRFCLEAVLVGRDQREVAFDAVRLQDALDDLLRPRIGVDRAPKKRMPLLKYHIVKFLCKFSNHFNHEWTRNDTNFLLNHRIPGAVKPLFNA